MDLAKRRLVAQAADLALSRTAIFRGARCVENTERGLAIGPGTFPSIPNQERSKHTFEVSKFSQGKD